MSETIITVQGLGKLYYIKGKKPRLPLRKRVRRLGKQARKTLGAPRRYVRHVLHIGLKAHASELLSWPHRNSNPGPESLSWEAPPGMFWALQDISFEVKQGEVLGIIGPNGAGKSTLLKILGRITAPTVGRAVIHGRVSSLLEVGTGFHHELSGRENIYLNGTILGMSQAEIDRSFDEVVDFSGVAKFIDTPIKHYSSGMKMRLAFSVAAHLNPEILLIDEVLAVGDVAFQEKCLKRMRGLTSAGRTVLFVSHSMKSITRFCSRAIWLENGRIVMEGPAQEVTDAYLSQMTRIKSSKQWQTTLQTAEKKNTVNDGSGGADHSKDTRTQIVTSGVSMAPTSSSDQKSTGRDKVVGFNDDQPPPGNEHVRLVSVRAINKDRQTIISISADQPVGIEMVYDVLTEEKLLLPVFRFYSDKEVHIFTTVYTDPEYLHKTKPVGRYRSMVWIPGHLLNVGPISVSAAMTTPGLKLERHFVEEKVIAFHVVEVPYGVPSAAGLHRDPPGAVRPMLTWETEPVK